MTATDSPHVITALGAWLGFWFIPCPSCISPLRLGAVYWWWPTVLPGSWHKLQMPGLTQGPLTLIGTSPPPPSWPSGASRASASHTSHPPARQHSTETFGPGFTAPASTSSPPYHQQWVTVYPRLSLWDMLVVQYNGKSCCSTSDKFPQNARLF